MKRGKKWVQALALVVLILMYKGVVFAEDEEPFVSGDEVIVEQQELTTPELIFRGLESKRLALEARAEAIAMEERKLKELKAEIDASREELETLRKQIETSLTRLESKEKAVNEERKAEEEKKIKQLVKLYSSMKPKKAAGIVNAMDLTTAQRLFMNMKGDLAGKILAYVEPQRAARISERLAETLKDLPAIP